MEISPASLLNLNCCFCLSARGFSNLFVKEKQQSGERRVDSRSLGTFVPAYIFLFRIRIHPQDAVSPSPSLPAACSLFVLSVALSILTLTTSATPPKKCTQANISPSMVHGPESSLTLSEGCLKSPRRGLMAAGRRAESGTKVWIGNYVCKSLLANRCTLGWDKY